MGVTPYEKLKKLLLMLKSVLHISLWALNFGTIPPCLIF